MHGYSQPFNNVALLSGQNDFIEIPNNFASSFSNEITIEAWVKPCLINGHRMILTKFYCPNNNNQFYFTILDGKLRWAWDNTGCADGANFYETGVIIQANVWQHIAVRHTNNGVTIFLDGLPVAGTLIQGSYSSMLFGNEPLRIGIYRTITNNWFGSYNGLMDEVRIWDYPVSNADILSRYQAPLTGNEAGLAGYYNMDITGSGAGTIVPNTAISAPTGTIDGVAIGTSNSPAFLNASGATANIIFGNDTTLCIGESLLLDASIFTGAYLWQDGSTDSSFTVTQPGLYYVSVTNSCEFYMDSIQVNYEPAPVVDFGNDTLLCQNATLLLSTSATPGASGHIWQDSSLNSTFLVNQPGIYSVFVDVAGCAGYGEIEVNYSNLYLELGPADSVICDNKTVSYDVSQPGASYLWQDGFTGSSYTIIDTGLYYVTISDAACQISDSINILINEVQADFSFIAIPQCGTTPVEYKDLSTLNFGIITNLIWFVDGKQLLFGSNPIQYVKSSRNQSVKLIATSNYNCKDDITIDVPVEVYAVPVVNFNINNLSPIPEEQILFVNSSANTDTYLWTFSDGYSTDSISPYHSFGEEGSYKVELTGFNSLCSNTIYKYITIKPPLRYYIPNAFTPDNNSFNQIFSPVFSTGFDPYQFELTIYNRWGEIVFYSQNSNGGWNGKYANSLVQSGVYMWKVDFIDTDINERVTDFGTVTVFY